MRNIKYLVVHCTAGGSDQSVSEIQAYWKNVLKWKNPGYHYIIDYKGNVVQLLDEDKPSNGVAGYNSEIINVCYIGGLIEVKQGKSIYGDTRSDSQKTSMRNLLKKLKDKYPKSQIRGHRDFSPDLNNNGKVDQFEWIKVCPCFDAIEEYKDL